MDSIGTTFYPLIQHIIIIYKSQSRTENELFNWNLFDSTPFKHHEWNFSKPFTNRKWIFPLESIRVYCPVDHLHLVGCFTTRLQVFQWNARGYDWSLGDSIGQPSISLQTIFTLTCLTSLSEMSKLRKTWNSLRLLSSLTADLSTSDFRVLTSHFRVLTARKTTGSWFLSIKEHEKT